MKTTHAAQTMTTNAAAEAFYGLDAAEFATQVARISVNDRRLEALFHKTRQRYLEAKVTPFLGGQDPTTA